MLCCARLDSQFCQQQLPTAQPGHTFWPVLLPPTPFLCCVSMLGLSCVLQVDIRACTSREAPIIVDANNVFRQVYVDGRMTWQGTIKFINSFPSPRRAGLWVLVSVLSIEEAGRIYMQVRPATGHGWEGRRQQPGAVTSQTGPA